MNQSTDAARFGARPDLQRPFPAPAPQAGNGHVSELQGGERNQLLRGLPAAAFEQLAPHLEPVELEARQVLWEPDTLIRAVYFPRTAVASLLTPLSDEAAVESATVGYEGMVGAPVVLRAPATHTKAITQLAGARGRGPLPRRRDGDPSGAHDFLPRVHSAHPEVPTAGGARSPTGVGTKSTMRAGGRSVGGRRRSTRTPPPPAPGGPAPGWRPDCSE